MSAFHSDDDEETQPLVLASDHEVDKESGMKMNFEYCDSDGLNNNSVYGHSSSKRKRQEDTANLIVASLKLLLILSGIGVCFGILSINYCRNKLHVQEGTTPSPRQRWCQSYLHAGDRGDEDDDLVTDFFSRDAFYRLFYDDDRPEDTLDSTDDEVTQPSATNEQPEESADETKHAAAEEPPPDISETTATERNVSDVEIQKPSEATEANKKPSTTAEALQQLNNFLDMSDHSASVTPVFWHIPKAAGSTMKEILIACHQLVTSTEFGVTDGHDKDETLAVVYPTIHSPGSVRNPYLNVDTTSKEGIERAVRLGFPANTHMLDAVTVRFLYDANQLFSSDHAKGRLFAVFRHPVERAVSMFYYLQRAAWEGTYHPEFQSWNLTHYAQSRWIEGNWMTRMLVREMGGTLTEAHFQMALTVLRRKFLVGLVSQLDESVARMERFFGWKYRVHPANQEACRAHLLNGGENVNEQIGNSTSNSNNGGRDYPEEGSQVWNMIAAHNEWDIRLYESAVQLFAEQSQLFVNVPSTFRQVNATCCECDPPTYPSPPDQYQCPQKVYDT